MNEKATQDELKNLENKTRERIEAGRDPHTAKWHENLESILIPMKDKLIPGELIATESLEPDKEELLKKLQIILDISPFTCALFLPNGIPDTAESPNSVLENPPEDSTKILVFRINDYNLILTAEISDEKPGIDIFDDGTLLASYNYNTSKECITDLSKIIWIHFKYKDTWTQENYIKYTEGWFFRSAGNKIQNLSINVNYSYIHHPVLLNINKVQAIFKLMKATLISLFKDIDQTIAIANAANLYKANTDEITKSGLLKGKENEKLSMRTYIDERLLGLLKLLRGYDIINFKGFSESEQREFKRSFSKTVEEVFLFFMKKIFNSDID